MSKPNFEVNGNTVYKGEETVGAIEGKTFLPKEGLHHKTVEAVEAYLATHHFPVRSVSESKTEKPSNEIPPAPERCPFQGVNTPEYREWAFKHLSKEELAKQYGNLPRE